MKHTFKNYGIDNSILKSIQYLGYEAPTDVQQEVIPAVLSGKNIVVQSQTGSGKTASFGIPICHQVEWEKRKPQVLVLAPTRELAIQIQEDLFNLGRFKRLKVEALFGRSSFEKQAQRLKEMTHILVATPGRLLDHMARETVDLSHIETLVIDEADEMFNMGFIDQITSIINRIPKKSQKLLFSATMPERVKDLCTLYIKNPQWIDIETESRVEDRIDERYYIVDYPDKMALLESVLITENPDSSIIFCNTKEQVETVTNFMEDLGCKVDTLHGGMEQRFRTKVLADFKHGLFRYLVATDVAARGLDIDDVSLVVNFDVPENTESYTHRVGRTARVDKYGKAVTFASPYEMKFMNLIINDTDHELQKVVKPGQSLVDARRDAFEAKRDRKPKVKKDKAHDFKQEITKIHINAGKKTKMRPVDVVGALCSIEGVNAEDIGVISIVDVSTFVEILNGKGDLVLNALKTMPIKGRPRKVNRANKTEYERLL
ncbi:DEAD/DEAH box helicase [Erysipelothrix amsterdamensis]|uniref:DEAD/DEAH box helicase n=1 Tax=Erysipelothrix amsterdamensis TaxID=2929157 RepID=A0AAU9VHE0_9FIRM|nr:DEAD/DEAH box helicase [Erysipelothrix rhusiopathiae]MDE8329798.1 DEAD/DEAH box helicase [Erysipelothrix rhusiopathiae]CAH2761256.1 DEAD/DEAH box helicase [Erysipelothrix sp. A18Y020d]CAH2761262.1 DEAD/DEAH box helicase [Erysipelothrix sp. A18Y020d]